VILVGFLIAQDSEQHDRGTESGVCRGLRLEILLTGEVSANEIRALLIQPYHGSMLVV
jgi:hypothetical protein